MSGWKRGGFTHFEILRGSACESAGPDFFQTVVDGDNGVSILARLWHSAPPSANKNHYNNKTLGDKQP